MVKQITNPKEIEQTSMEIIEGLLQIGHISGGEKQVIKRIVHTTGDPAIAPMVRFSPAATKKGISALKGGASVYTDVKMVQVGIRQKALQGLGGQLYCGISDPQVIEQAARTGRTRAMTALRSWGERLQGNVVAIGNAPTALYELLHLAAEEKITPALVVGVPVGFVGAAESKEALMNSPLPYISIAGSRGGSTIAAAIINALLIMAAGEVG